MKQTDSLPARRDPSDRCAHNEHLVEHLVHRALRNLPPLRAPRSLQARVLTTVEHRNQAWWRRSFTLWPLPVRIAFSLVCAAIAKLSVDGSLWLLSSAPGPREFGLWEFESSTFAAWRALVAVHASLLASIPAPWWYGALAVIAIACGGVFAIGTIAYRTLYAARS